MSAVRKEIIVLVVYGAAALTTAIFITKDECPDNEEYLLCGSACPFNCSDPEGPITCNEECVEGCFCKSGYLRDDNGTCVTADQCIERKNGSICGENEEFLSCGTACPLSCSQSEQLTCNLACSMGCFCKSGYVRDTANNKCVTLDKCPVEECFNENEVYDLCNASCEPSCADPEPICSQICTSGCVCAPGLLRNESGACVTANNCGNSSSTDPGLVGRYLDVINKILHFNLTTTAK